MNEPLSFYQKQAEIVRSLHPMLAKIQEAGLCRLKQVGFPTRHDEDWKYSQPDAFLKERFVLEGKKHLTEILHWGESALSRDVFVGSFDEALAKRPHLLEPYLPRLSIGETGFHALNTSMLQTSLVIYLPKHHQLHMPVTVHYFQNQAHQARYSRTLLILEAGAQLTLIEDYQGQAQQPYFTNSVTEAFLHEGAQLTHLMLQRESEKAIHWSHFIAHQAAQSKLDSHAVHLGGQWVRSDKSFYLQGEKASCLLNGVYGLSKQQHLDQHTLVSHEVGGCESKQDYKGVLTGPSRAVFNGRVVVKRDAQQTIASQQNKNLLLSRDAEVDTKPQLEIDANEVMCTHGATVGQLSEEALFYFRSRGITQEEAMRFLVDAFTAVNLALIEDKALRATLTALLHAHLGLERGEEAI